jgi:hypothetical protein
MFFSAGVVTFEENAKRNGAKPRPGSSTNDHSSDESVDFSVIESAVVSAAWG